jgi:UDP-2,3-diacylglucosamine pyrophosphatase LpxH
MKVVVVSDEHLGYAHSDSPSFSAFLDSLSTRGDVGSLVILGDFVDMWRRDVSGLFLEAHDVLRKLLALASTFQVYVVAGNHDYHLLQLKDHGYPFEAKPSLSLDGGGSTKYHFLHGWEFDLAQQPVVRESLCHNLSDEAGGVRTDVYSGITRLGSAIADLLHFHGGTAQYIDHLMQPPEQRLQPYLPDVERKAFSWQGENGGILVFGHTHRPFVSADGTVVNSGSWVTDATVHNTYVELDGGLPRLFVFNGQEVTERVPRPV